MRPVKNFTAAKKALWEFGNAVYEAVTSGKYAG